MTQFFFFQRITLILNKDISKACKKRLFFYLSLSEFISQFFLLFFTIAVLIFISIANFPFLYTHEIKYKYKYKCEQDNTKLGFLGNGKI